MSEIDTRRPGEETRRRILDRRRDLYSAMQTLEGAVVRASGAADWRQQVEAALLDLETCLDEHAAAVEAPDGLFAEVVETAPHLAAAVDGLRVEHRQMLDDCRRALAILVEGVEPAVIKRTVLDLVRLISEHRQNGAELLYDAYNLDIGAAD